MYSLHTWHCLCCLAWEDDTNITAHELLCYAEPLLSTSILDDISVSTPESRTIAVEVELVNMLSADNVLACLGQDLLGGAVPHFGSCSEVRLED